MNKATLVQQLAHNYNERLRINSITKGSDSLKKYLRTQMHRLDTERKFLIRIANEEGFIIKGSERKFIEYPKLPTI